MSRLLTRLICNFDDDEEWGGFQFSSLRNNPTSLARLYNNVFSLTSNQLLWSCAAADLIQCGRWLAWHGPCGGGVYMYFINPRKFITISAQIDRYKRMLSTATQHHHQFNRSERTQYPSPVWSSHRNDEGGLIYKIRPGHRRRIRSLRLY